MFTSMRTETRAEPLDAASLRQQRRLKQALRFLHRDSADLLPLDGLKKLGTAKQGVCCTALSFHTIFCRNGCWTDVRGRTCTLTCTLTPNSGVSHSPFKSNEEEEKDFMYVPGKCLGRDVNVLIDTGCRVNLMSSSTVDRLGLQEQVEENKVEAEVPPFQRRLSVDGKIPELGLTVGQHRILCSFFIVESNKPLISLGNKSLKSLKCVFDTEKLMLVFGTNVREQVHFVQKPFNKSSFNLGDL